MEITQEQRKENDRKLLILLFLIISVFGGCYYMMGDKSTTTTTSNTEFCNIHNITYSTKNAYGGCPKCVKQQQADDAAKGLEKKIYGK
ncbi:hypothetical protein ACFOG5_09725 [Pedobacter fastidiosus]|uniref:Membrane or secreted protein n=1 Tax=Pedobacter fastidiosus TaxID=2765361 RepID=A0ABR7KZ47_9SPHI|nr:hypothetical protein [Pedobacter fastidiosus]MBC6112988.1 hypothetical protein [Pedobacter fastidiosus]